MSYRVLARKWRPANFGDVVGQQHILQSLSHALNTDRLHHALLFTGTRGVGKTTIARILAKALNCEQGISDTPCGVCNACTSIDEGRYIDLIEVDAASKTKVDDTRDLLDNVQYLPTTGRYKVYLIDEVHMLSRHSFNALLKTLEEPPDHVKFLLATTDPQQLPITVLSRCLQFNLKRLEPSQIKSQLERILQTEKVESDEAALDLLASSADGSMRDGLSLLDQAIAYGSGTVFAEDVRTMLGSIEQRYIQALIDSLVSNDTNALFLAINDAADRSPDFMMVLNEMLSCLYHLSLMQMAPVLVEQRGLDKEWLQQASSQVSAEHLQLLYQICLTGKRDLPLAPDTRTGFEMLMLRLLAFKPPSVNGENGASPVPAAKNRQPAQVTRAATSAKTAQSTQSTQSTPSNNVASKAAVSVTDNQYARPQQNIELAKVQEPVARKAKEDPRPTVPSSSAAVNQAESATMSEQPVTTKSENLSGSRDSPNTSDSSNISNPKSAIDSKDWAGLVSTLSITGLTKQLALHMAPSSWDDTKLELLLDEEHEAIHSSTREKELMNALQTCFAGQLKISLRIDKPVAETPAKQKQRLSDERQQGAVDSIKSDSTVSKIVDAFGASVAPSSIRPLSN